MLWRGLIHEYRQYLPGDDLSTMDWKVFARTDRHYVKKFEEETNLRGHLVLDVSASMTYGSGAMTKLEYGSCLAASLAYLPLVSVDGDDTHWLRTGPPGQGFDFSGPTPITAEGGNGLQVEAALRWRTTLGFTLGLGGRFTRLEARDGLLHFERSVYPVNGRPAVAQVASLATERRLAWLEAAWRY